MKTFNDYLKTINEGAHSGMLKFPGTWSQSRVKSEVDKIIKKARRQNKSRNDGYTGDWDTIDSVKFSFKTFDDEDSAYDHTLDKAQKWSYAVAAKYQDKKSKKSEWIVGAWLAEENNSLTTG